VNRWKRTDATETFTNPKKIFANTTCVGKTTTGVSIATCYRIRANQRERRRGGVMAAAETNGGETEKTPVHLWIVGVLALLWNLMGAFDYLATQLQIESYMANYTPEQLEYFYGIPAWAVAGWAIAVWFALAGSIGLLLRKCWAVWVFGVSIAGMVVSTIHSFLLSNGAEIMGGAAIVFSVLIWVIAIGLFLYARAMCNRGVLT
jgi:hypothetical protein